MTVLKYMLSSELTSGIGSLEEGRELLNARQLSQAI